MPNHVKNILDFEGDEAEIERLKSETQSPGGPGEEDLVLDFNRLIPMPASLEMEGDGVPGLSTAALLLMKGRPVPESLSWDADLILRRFGDDGPKAGLEGPGALPEFIRRASLDHSYGIDLRLGEAGLENLRRYGAVSWYEWRVEHWGTKWNSYMPTEDGRRISFLTAWTPPEPVYKVLSERFPRVAFTLRCAIEGEDRTYWEGRYEKGACRSMRAIEDPARLEAVWAEAGTPFVFRERTLEKSAEPSPVPPGGRGRSR